MEDSNTSSSVEVWHTSPPSKASSSCRATDGLHPTAVSHPILLVLLTLGIFRGGFYIKSVFEQGQVSRLKIFLSSYNSTIRDIALWHLHELPLKK